MRLAATLVSVSALFVWQASGDQTAASSELQKAVEEFKVQTRSLGLRADSPRRSRKNGASKASFHGRIFENFRNDFLDAVPHEIRQRGGDKNLLRRNQFGFNLTGPVVIPRLFHGGRQTFFSISYEAVRERISRSYLRTIPTMAERTGDWSAVVDPSGSPLPIFDPRSTRLNSNFDPTRPVTTENLQYLRDPFPANRIPAERLDPVALRALQAYPAPNTDVGPFFRNNFFVLSPEANAANGMIIKLDHILTDRHRFSFGLSYSNGLSGAAAWFPSGANPGPSDRLFNSRRASAEHVFTISARALNTFTMEAETDGSQNSTEDSADFGALLGLRGVAAGTFPNFSISPYLSMGRANAISKTVRNNFIFTNAFSLRHGKHSIRVTGQFIRYQVNALVPQYPAGQFRFRSNLTSLPGITNTGHAFASFLLGLSEYAEISVVDSPSYFRRSRGLLVLREQYQPREGLTLSVGLNLDAFTPRVEKYNRQSTIDLNTINPENGRLGALVVAGRNGLPRSFQPPSIRLAPSASISWNPLGDTRSVVRASYSRSYSSIPIYSSQFGTQAFNGTPTYISPNVQLQPAVTLRDGLPPPARPFPDFRPEGANDTVADLIDRTTRQPRYQSASFSFERQLPAALVVTLGFGHADGKNLLTGTSSANPNAIPLGALAYRDRLNDEQFNRALRPYPQFRGFEVYSSYPIGRYWRDEANIRLEKRSSQGLSLSASYEFSKQMDDYSGRGRQDYYSRENEWSLTSYNRPHRLSFTYAYELPLGPNKRLLSETDWMRYIVAGWTVSGSTSLLSGEPLILAPQFNNTGNVVQHLRVNVVPGVDPRVENPSPHLWFNPAAFDQPPDFTIGNGPRTHPALRSPVFQNHDLSLTKRFTISPERTVEFSAVGLNFLNHANWTDPDTEIGPANAPNVNAGRIVGSTGSRVIQLGVRFNF